MGGNSPGEAGRAQGAAQNEVVTPIGGAVPDAGAYAISEAKTALPTPVPGAGGAGAAAGVAGTGTVPAGGPGAGAVAAGGSGRSAGAAGVSSDAPTVGMAPPPKELTPPEEILPTGALVDGRYEVLSTLGRGGMGAVYRARDRVLDEEVALKVLLPAVVSAPGMAARFLVEAKTSLALTHPGIVRVRSFERDAERGTAFIVMALVKGRSLRALLRERGRFEGKDALDLVAKVLDALVVAHRVTVHRDLKPENIMVEESGQPVVLDFGLAKAARGGGLSGITQSGAVMGTYAYMAPEQGLDSSQVDARADVYAMGAILYELWTGRLPQGAFPPPGKVRGDLPPGADEVALRALSYVVEERHQSAQAMLDAVNGLRAWYGGGAGPAEASPRSATAAGGGGALAAPTPAEEHPTAPHGRRGDTVRVEPRAPARPAPPPAPGYAQPALIVVAVLALVGIAAEISGILRGRDRAPQGASPADPVAGGGASARAASASPSPSPPLLPPGAKLPARVAPPPPPPSPDRPPDPTSAEHLALEGERAWAAFLASARPFEAFPTQALLDAWPALEGRRALVHVRALTDVVEVTGAHGERLTARQDDGGDRVLARWVGLEGSERWLADEVGFQQTSRQDVVGVLVGVVRRSERINDEEVVREWPLIEVRWKWVRGRCAIVPPPGGGEGAVVAGEESYQAALRARWTDPKLLSRPSPRQVVEAAVRAVKEGNRPLFDALSARSRACREAMDGRWHDLRPCFRGRGPQDDPRAVRDWLVGEETVFRDFRGEPQARLDVAFTSAAGVAGYMTDTWDLVQEGGAWRLGTLDEFTPLPRSGLAPPPPDATPEQVYALFLRAAMEDDEDLARKLVLPDKVDVASGWLKDWQLEYRRGMTDSPPGQVHAFEGEGPDVVEVVSAPTNTRPGMESWPRKMVLRRMGGAWRVAQGYHP